MAADDLFARVRRLEAELTSNGREDVALQLADAVAAGATGTEILMRVRWLLQEATAGDTTLPPSLRARLEAVLAGVDALLST